MCSGKSLFCSASPQLMFSPLSIFLTSATIHFFDRNGNFRFHLMSSTRARCINIQFPVAQASVICLHSE